MTVKAEKETLTEQSSTSRLLLYICKLRFPKYPSYYYPVYLIAKLLQETKFKFEVRQLDFLLQAIPNRYFDFLCRDHEILSDHTIFLNQKVFDYYVYQKEVNFLNLTLSDATRKSTKLSKVEKVVNKILDSTEKSDKTLTVCQVFPLNGVPINKIYIKENSYWNFVDKFKLNQNREVFVNLSMLIQNQMLPGIATKANIFLVKTPCDVPNAFIDDVLGEYFRRARLLYRNHTYRIDLTEEELGNFVFVEHFLLITKLKRIYFKCVHLESTGCDFENAGIVVKTLTNLTQTTTINYQVPKVLMGEHFVTSYPLGLKDAYDQLKSSILPFTETSKTILKSRKIFPIIQICGERGSGKRKILQSVADSLGMHIHFAECCEIVTAIASQTEQKILYTLHKATNCQPIIICFNDFEFFGKNNEGHEDDRVLSYFKNEIEKLFMKHTSENPIIIVALVNSSEPLKLPKLSGIFLETITVPLLEKDQRFLNLLWYHQREKFDRLCYGIKCGKLENYIDIKVQNIDKNDIGVLKKISEQTQGFILGDLRVLYEKSISKPTEDFLNFHLDENIFIKTLIEIKKCFSQSIGTPEIVKVRWDDIGGLANLKTEIQNSIRLPLKYSHLMSRKLKRSGILL
jgi:peroxin-6